MIQVRMEPSEWNDWWDLAERHTRLLGRRAYCKDGSRKPLSFSRLAQWRVTHEHPFRVYFKYSHLKTEEWKYLEVKKSQCTKKMTPRSLKPCNQNKVIKKAKYDDLQKISHHLKAQNRAFYKDLRHDGIDEEEGDSDDEAAQPDVRPFRFEDSWLSPSQLYV